MIVHGVAGRVQGCSLGSVLTVWFGWGKTDITAAFGQMCALDTPTPSPAPPPTALPLVSICSHCRMCMGAEANVAHGMRSGAWERGVMPLWSLSHVLNA